MRLTLNLILILTARLSMPVCRAADDLPAAESRGIEIRPLPADLRSEAGFDKAESAGLFVGVQTFSLSGSGAAPITAIPYAVDDAVDLAYLFTVELELIEVKRITLALAGTPVKPETQRRLKELVDRGAQLTRAGYTELLQHITRTAAAARPRGVLIMSFATHGYSSRGDRLLAEDALLRDLVDTSIPVSRILDDITSSRAPRRLLLLDACRERLTDTRTVKPQRMSRSFTKALASARGMAVLSATTQGGVSFDDPNRMNGVFTAEVLAALRGAAPADNQGIIVLDAMARYVDERVRAWVEENRPDQRQNNQGIGYHVDDVRSGALPLAIVGTRWDEYTAREARKRRLLEVLKQYVGSEHISPQMEEEMTAALETSDAPVVDALLERLEQLEREGAAYTPQLAAWWSAGRTPRGAKNAQQERPRRWGVLRAFARPDGEAVDQKTAGKPSTAPSQAAPLPYQLTVRAGVGQAYIEHYKVEGLLYGAIDIGLSRRFGLAGVEAHLRRTDFHYAVDSLATWRVLEGRSTLLRAGAGLEVARDTFYIDPSQDCPESDAEDLVMVCAYQPAEASLYLCWSGECPPRAGVSVVNMSPVLQLEAAISAKRFGGTLSTRAAWSALGQQEVESSYDDYALQVDVSRYHPWKFEVLAGMSFRF